MTLATEQQQWRQERMERLKAVVRIWCRLDSPNSSRCDRLTRRAYYRGFLNGLDTGYYAGTWRGYHITMDSLAEVGK